MPTPLSLHPVITSNAKEHRLQRLRSPSPDDNRITYGCINVPKSFYAGVIRPLIQTQGGVAYILPESRPLEQVFAAALIQRGPVGVPVAPKRCGPSNCRWASLRRDLSNTRRARLTRNLLEARLQPMRQVTVEKATQLIDVILKATTYLPLQKPEAEAPTVVKCGSIAATSYVATRNDLVLVGRAHRSKHACPAALFGELFSDDLGRLLKHALQPLEPHRLAWAPWR